MDLHHIIQSWWTMKVAPKLDTICRAIPAFIMWCLSKRKNDIKHGRTMSFIGVMCQIQDLIRKLIKFLYPWMKVRKEVWPNIINIRRSYKPILHCHSVIWSFVGRNKLKCSIDGSCKGKPSLWALGLLY